MAVLTEVFIIFCASFFQDNNIVIFIHGQLFISWLIFALSFVAPRVSVWSPQQYFGSVPTTSITILRTLLLWIKSRPICWNFVNTLHSIKTRFRTRNWIWSCTRNAESRNVSFNLINTDSIVWKVRNCESVCICRMLTVARPPRASTPLLALRLDPNICATFGSPQRVYGRRAHNKTSTCSLSQTGRRFDSRRVPIKHFCCRRDREIPKTPANISHWKPPATILFFCGMKRELIKGVFWFRVWSIN